MFKNPCVSCKRNVNTKTVEPLCQSCRKAARTRACSYCGIDYANRDPNRMTCSPAHGAAYAKWARYGWTLNAVRQLVEEVRGMLANKC